MTPSNFAKHLELQHLIDSNGDILKNKTDLVSPNELKATQVVKSMLGMTLNIRGERYLLTNLELYYGSAQDLAHDWYRAQFSHQYKSKARASHLQSAEQTQQGPSLYLNQKGSSRYKRMDIVIGKEGVAVSVLVRNVADKNRKLLGQINGQPNKVLNLMGICDSDHGKKLVGESDVLLLPRPDDLQIDDFQIISRLRFQNGKFSGFVDLNDQRRWNFSIAHLF